PAKVHNGGSEISAVTAEAELLRQLAAAPPPGDSEKAAIEPSELLASMAHAAVQHCGGEVHCAGRFYFGDDIFFMRYLPEMCKTAPVVLVVPPELERLARSLGVPMRVGPSEGAGFYFSVLQLSSVQAKFFQIPAPVPYLEPITE